MAASLSGVWNSQDFTDNGFPLVAGRLYTYAPTTTTLKVAYTDPAGTIPHTYTADGIGGQYIALNARGELPAPLFLLAGGYDLALKRADGSTVWGGRRAIGTSDDANTAVNTLAAQLADPNTAGLGDSLVAVKVAYTGARARTQHDRNNDTVSVMDFVGVDPTGVGDSTAGIQAAFNTGKNVFFPKPSAYYRTTAPLVIAYTCRILGENGFNTTIRNSNTGMVFQIQAQISESIVFEHIRIGGAVTCIGIGADNGSDDYASRVVLRNVHFERDLLVCVQLNLIYANWSDCTFGYLRWTTDNPQHQWIISQTNGVFNTNLNVIRQCGFFRGGATTVGIVLSGGILWAFEHCDWSFSGRILSADNIQSLVFGEGCYTENCKTPAAFQGLIALGPSLTVTKFKGGHWNGGINTTNAAIISYGGENSPIEIDGGEWITSATSFIAYDNANVSSSYPNRRLTVRNIRAQGNTNDPVQKMDNIRESMNYPYTPVATGLTIVNGTGAVTITGFYSVVGYRVFVEILITTTGTATTASTFGTTTLTLPAGFPPQRNGLLPVNNNASGAALGNARAATNNTIILPAWAAQNGTIALSGSYPIGNI